MAPPTPVDPSSSYDACLPPFPPKVPWAVSSGFLACCPFSLFFLYLVCIDGLSDGLAEGPCCFIEVVY